AVGITAWTDGARSSVLSEQVDTTAADGVNARQGSLEVRSAADEANGTPHIQEVTDKTDSKRTVLQSLVLEMCATNYYSENLYLLPVFLTPSPSNVQVPDVPNHLHVNYAETDLLNVQWRVPTVNYECVQGYIVCWRSSGDQTEGCLNTTNLEQVITGLTPCMNYSINITAVGVIGASQTAHMSARTRSQAFNDISILEVKSSNSTTLEVEWKAPTKNSECVQEYKVCWIGQETGEEGCTIQTRAITKATITGLTSCVNYTVNVTAGGDLKNSSVVSMPVMTNSTLIQDKPAIQNLSLSMDSESNITVTWHPLAEGMMCVRSYNVCWEQQSQPEDSQCLELPSSEDHLTISGLHSGTTYTVE
ncbi:unnamed protein product, partial [Timema podura]|nr:unnamed protein product [Timema podura]